MKPPYYHLGFTECGVELSPLAKLAWINRLDEESKQLWRDYFKENPTDERAQFVMRNLNG